MNVCPHCAASLESNSLTRERPKCPCCGNGLHFDKGPAWTDVARLTNLAEAGFLTDELVGQDVDARIFQLDEFSAIVDRWATAYYIRVPTAQASAAAAWVRGQLADDAGQDSDAESCGFRFSNLEESLDPTFWRPMALIVLAGVASFVLGQHFSDQNAGRMARGNSLLMAVDRIGRALVTEPARGEPRHRLMFDRRHDAWCLDTDRDGDGSYDIRQQFHSSGAAW